MTHDSQESVDEAPMSLYVVQRMVEGRLPYAIDVASGEEASRDAIVWEDIATIEVRARTKRKAVIAQALIAARLSPAEGLVLRVLDGNSAERLTIAPDDRPPPPNAFRIVR